MFTCIFALARTVGWMTQWEEMINDPEYKIGRPRQLYVGTSQARRHSGSTSARLIDSKGRRQ
jgi:citrate synthase